MIKRIKMEKLEKVLYSVAGIIGVFGCYSTIKMFQNINNYNVTENPYLLTTIATGAISGLLSMFANVPIYSKKQNDNTS